MTTSYQKIVCPVDFSEPSELALAQAVAMAKQNDAELHVLTVIQPVPAAAFSDGAVFNELTAMPQQSSEKVRNALAKLCETFCEPVKKQISQHVTVGIPFIEIVRYAREAAADLIVMGSHGLTGIEHLLIGSVAERVVRKAPCSVLVVRNAEHPAAQNEQF